LRKESGPLQHADNFFPAGAQFVPRIEQVVGTHGISITTGRIAKAPHVERFYESLNVCCERSIRFERPL
jgi:hypothetical protein